MNRDQIIKEIYKTYPDIIIKEKTGNQADIFISKNIVTAFLNHMKSIDFKHLSNLTCVDRIDDDSFEVIYNIWSYLHKIHITVRVLINREKPELPTIGPLWPQAYVYEREIHEMFGVKFNGNPDLSPLFLHNWQDIPPLRKDFDTEKYSIDTYNK